MEIKPEWENEPDKLFWTDKDTGYHCAIKRQPMKYLCGYVQIPRGHPFYRINYCCDLIPARKIKEVWVKGKKYFYVNDNYSFHERPDSFLSVHYGVTYGDMDDGRYLPKGFWYGFHCSHSGDYSPGASSHFEGEVYRSIEYVKKECRKLAKQLKKLGGKND